MQRRRERHKTGEEQNPKNRFYSASLQLMPLCVEILKGVLMHVNDLSSAIISSAIEVHKTLGGPGLLEGVYEEALSWELSSRGVKIVRQMEVPVSYKGNKLTS